MGLKQPNKVVTQRWWPPSLSVVGCRQTLEKWSQDLKNTTTQLQEELHNPGDPATVTSTMTKKDRYTILATQVHNSNDRACPFNSLFPLV